jgi:hypothetical protein
MPLPSTVLIGTNIFDQHAYHFASAQISKFTALAQLRKFTLLLPNALEREVVRHIKEKSTQAQSALRKARREAHFLPKWSHWPSDEKVKNAQFGIESAAMEEWQQFLKHFKVLKLGYDKIDMTQVMDWYDQKQPPFCDGPKQKEFPDAFILAATVACAKAKETKIAVVSADHDFKRFCANHSELIYFCDLPSLIEAFIAETKTQIAAIKEALTGHPDHVIKAISEHFSGLVFYPEEDPEGDVSDIQVESVSLTVFHVIAIEEHDCTIAFDAEVDFSAFVSYDDPDSLIIDTAEDIRIALHTRSGTVQETTDISGTVTIEFCKEWKAVISVFDLELETRDVSVSARPPVCYDNDGEDEPPYEDIEPPEPPTPVMP